NLRSFNTLILNQCKSDLGLSSVLHYLNLKPKLLNYIKEKPSNLLDENNNTLLQGQATISRHLVSLKQANLLGKNDVDKALVDQWVSFSNDTPLSDQKLTSLEQHLKSSVFLFVKFQNFTNVTRYFDLIQHIVNAEEFKSDLFKKINFDLNAPVSENGKETIISNATTSTVEKPKENSKKIEKKEESKEVLPTGEKSGKKEKKEKKQSAPAPVAETKSITPDRILFKVGKILSVNKHPDADSLYIESIDLGEEKPRQVVSGLVKWLKPEQMMNKLVICVCNLKPAKMRGVESQAMVLCGECETVVELINPPKGSTPGNIVYFKDFKGNADAQLKPKEKVWETCQPNFKVNNKLQATYIVDGKEHVLETEKGLCNVVSAELKGAKIK
ncbi:Aminoacyl tRNA synthase complex-interacting multifunctional protein 1, partial [Clydaea vesicula]